MVTKLDRALPKIIEFFKKRQREIFKHSELREIFLQYKTEWDLTQAMTFSQFLEILKEQAGLSEIRLKSEHYSPLVRYAFSEEPSEYTLALSLRPGSYLSHGTAVFLHNLNDQVPKTVYVNREQTPKPKQKGTLSQERIRLAFSRAQRVSALEYTHKHRRILLLSGKNTARLEVGTIVGPQNEQLYVTKLERTLIDIVVRPVYAGGVVQVLEAFRAARDQVSMNVFAATLKGLDFTYPYHQAIGFFMQRAGYPENRLTQLRNMGIAYDFYLVHGLKNADYDPSWRLFHPKGL